MLQVCYSSPEDVTITLWVTLLLPFDSKAAVNPIQPKTGFRFVVVEVEMNYVLWNFVVLIKMLIS